MTTYLLGAIVRLWHRAFKNGSDKGCVEVEEDRRDRDAYEAEIAKVDHDHLSRAEAAEVDELRAFVEEVRTGEQTLVLGSQWAFDADPLSAPIPDDMVTDPPTLFADVVANRLSAFTWTAEPAPSVPLASVWVPEVDPLELDGPTGVFPKEWKERAMAARAEGR